MILGTNDLFLLSQCAISAAYQAGHIISSYTYRQVTVKNKTAGESLASQVVTEVDLLSQNIILKTLNPTCDIYDLAVLAEESTDDWSRLEKDFFWCIDPLDGTLPFVESTPGYAVSVALVARDGTPYIGVIYDPVEQTLYHAVKGGGLFRNGHAWQPTSVPAAAGQALTFITDRSFVHHPQFKATVAELKCIAIEMGYDDVHLIQHGGAAMNAGWVLEKGPACYFKFPKPQEGGGSLWDYAATACLFQEAGASVGDIHGAPLDLNRPDSTFMNHRGVLFASDQMLARCIRELYRRMMGQRQAGK
ncbi:inositol monophosphatase family protein [Marinilabiliaceae bacterium JC017]|nr:inositol monophosphatase family protein [Marinilabiliaceae bacterium JC017]